VSALPPSNGDPRHPQNLGATITDITERATLLVHEEIELAKAELNEKATKLARGAAVGVVAGIFFATALLFVLIGCAWLIYFYLPVNDFAYFWGFFAMAGILVMLGVAAGLMAARAVKRGSPPVPTMAIDEARRIRETVAGPSHDGAGVPRPPGAVPTTPASSTPAPPPTPPPVPPPAAAAEPVSAAQPPKQDGAAEPTPGGES
jgi:hypothetical protein